MKTNYLLLSLLALLIFNIGAKAQSDMKPRFGVRGGANFTGRMYEEGATTFGDRDLIPNFHVGAVADIPLSPNWHMQPEVQFLRAGYKSTYKTADVKADTIQRISYINIPVAFNYYFRNVNVKPYLSMGPYVGYAVSGNVKWENNQNGTTNEGSRSAEFGKNGLDHLKRFDAGVMLGVGLDLDLVNIEFKYGQSLMNLYAGNNDSVFSLNMNLALSVLILF